MKRIGLYGIGGVYNFGCEAIVRGAVDLIRDLYTDVSIIYFSNSFEYDSRMLADLGIDIIEIQDSDSLIKKGIRKVSKILNLEHRPLKIEYKDILKRVDEIWSIGGDLYTIPEVVRNKTEYEYYLPIVDFCNRAIDEGKTVVLYGASVGPFGNYSRAEEYFRKNLGKYKMVLCREMVSYEYLNGMGLSNVSFFPDPAFQVHGDLAVDEEDKRFIGLNLSPLSLDEIYGNHNKESQQKMAGVVSNILSEFDYDILMIPHVIAKAEHDDDLRFQQNIIDLLEEDEQERIKIADYSGGFIGLKPQLRECRFVVSARMHCAINAMVELVPAIMLSYSQKTIGMAEYVYGNDEWVVNLKEIHGHLIPTMKEMDLRNDSIREDLKQKIIDIDCEFQELKTHIIDTR